jgi:hypothetical protein
MRTLSIAIAVSAAAVAMATPAQAQRWSDPGFQAAANVTVHRDGPRHRLGDAFRAPADDRRFDRRRRGGVEVGYGWYGGEWALYNNRSWEADSYNDWWHDRPDRAYPRWVSQNRRGCDRGQWYSGDTLRC